jgi:hypothetical protein
MKKILILFPMVLFMFMAYPAGAQEGVKISGAVEIHYRYSDDLYSAEGDDRLRPEELYVRIQKEIAKDIFGMIQFDGADLVNDDKLAEDDAIEEAQVFFKNVLGSPLTLIFGKDEMPFGQDYEKFLISSETHGFEIDKVWGFHAVYKIENFGSIAGAFFKRGTSEDTGLFESYTAKIKANKLVDNLSIEASYASTGEDDSVPAEVDEDRFSVGGVYKLPFVPGLTVHAEYTTLTDFSNTSNRDLDVVQIGADYRIDKWLLKVRNEFIDDDNPNEEENILGIGISYYFIPSAFATVEYENVDFEGATSSTDEILVGAKFKY